MDINQLNRLYRGEFGERAALQELVPVLRRFTSAGAQLLEVGCGYGRNFQAYRALPEIEVVGSDVSQADLRDAATKIGQIAATNIRVVMQTERDRLPFADDSFDFVVLWQVMEHVLAKADKARLLDEATRVLKSGGYVLIQTPNQLFPIDYHDTNLPLVHWIFPDSWRQALIRRVRHADYPPSQYTTVPALRKYLAGDRRSRVVSQATAVFFQKRYTDIFRNLGTTRRLAKVIYFALYFPIYLLLRLAGRSGDLLMPSLRLVFRIDKTPSRSVGAT